MCWWVHGTAAAAAPLVIQSQGLVRPLLCCAGLPNKFFGPFDQASIPIPFPLNPGQSITFNRPEGCVEQQLTVTIAGQPYSKPNGIEACDTNKNGNQ
jgi:hypothetical protein